MQVGATHPANFRISVDRPVRLARPRASRLPDARDEARYLERLRRLSRLGAEGCGGEGVSWEVFGTSGDGQVDADVLYGRGWESDPDGEKWWKAGEPETVFTLDEAIRAYEDWLYED